MAHVGHQSSADSAVSLGLCSTPPCTLITVGFYSIEQTIGRGNFAFVKLARHRLTNTDVAVKIVNKRKLDRENLRKVYREIELLRRLNHPYIIKVYQVMETENMIYLVTEYAKNGEMFDVIASRKRLSEREARERFWQIVSAVEYCHARGVVHRDIKAENLLLDAKNTLKLADFGFSNFFKKDEQLATFCGSPPYAAPEVFEGKKYYGPHIDVWSLGVLLYTFVCGALPFEGRHLNELRERVLSGRFRVPYFMSSDCENLIKRMLTKEASKRITLAQVKKHKWMQEDGCEERIREEIEVHDLIHKCLPKAKITTLMEKIGVVKELAEEEYNTGTFNNVVGIFRLMSEKWMESTLESYRNGKITLEELRREAERNSRDAKDEGEESISKASEKIAEKITRSLSASFGEHNWSKRMSTGSSDEGVDINSPDGVSCSYMGDSPYGYPYESFEAQFEAEQAVEDSHSTPPCEAVPMMNSSVKSSLGGDCAQSPSTESFGECRWRLSDNTMCVPAGQKPFPTGTLEKKTDDLGEVAEFERIPSAVASDMEAMQIGTKRQNVYVRECRTTNPKRISLPECLSMQPQKLLNLKQALHVEEQMAQERDPLEKNHLFRIKVQIKRHMRNAKTIRQHNAQTQRGHLNPSKLASQRHSEEPSTLEPIHDGREDIMDTS